MDTTLCPASFDMEKLHKLFRLLAHGAFFVKDALVGSRTLTLPEQRISLRKRMADGDVKEALAGLWNRVPLDQLPTFRDLPRLIRRIRVLDIENNVVFPPFGPMDDNSMSRTIELVKFFVLCLVKQLEGEDRFKEVTTILSSSRFRVPVTSGSNLGASDMYVEDILMSLGSEETSATLRLLKTMNQSFISHCAFVLKKGMTNLTKDVRGPDGWIIDIQVISGGVVVKHVRKEQSLEPDRNHWVLRWQIYMSFDETVSVMNEAIMELLDLTLSEGIEARVASSVQRDLLRMGTV